ncbi:MAG: hypothetical protein NVSMB9_33310 [Isosphaeraceae bacterium]
MRHERIKNGLVWAALATVVLGAVVAFGRGTPALPDPAAPALPGHDMARCLPCRTVEPVRPPALPNEIGGGSLPSWTPGMARPPGPGVEPSS